MGYLLYGYMNNDRKYPVIYFQYGIGENEMEWVNLGKMNFICDNLVAQRKAVPSVVDRSRWI